MAEGMAQVEQGANPLFGFIGRHDGQSVITGRWRLRGVDGQTDQAQVGGARDWLMPDGPIGAIDR